MEWRDLDTGFRRSAIERLILVGCEHRCHPGDIEDTSRGKNRASPKVSPMDKRKVGPIDILRSLVNNWKMLRFLLLDICCIIIYESGVFTCEGYIKDFRRGNYL